MESPNVEEIPPPDCRRSSTIEGLSSGRQAAAELKALLGEATGPAARELVHKVLSSFSTAIYDLTTGEQQDFKQESVTTVVGSPGGSVNQGSDYSAMKKRRISSAAKERRGGCRRRSNGSEIRRVLAKTLDDGFTWRKYGQKDIYSSIFPRSYFRCTHKHDRGCQATRQVQKSEEDSNIYVITYIGDHTCNDPPIAPFNTLSNSRGSCVISFGSSSVDDVVAQGPFVCPPSFPAAAAAKQENYEEEVLSSQNTPTCSRSSTEFLLCPTMDQFAGIPDGGDVSSLPMTFLEDMYLNWDDFMG